jgi:hypothetical protein
MSACVAAAALVREGPPGQCRVIRQRRHVTKHVIPSSQLHHLVIQPHVRGATLAVVVLRLLRVVVSLLRVVLRLLRMVLRGPLRGGMRGHDDSSRVLRGGVRGHDNSSRVLRGGVRGHDDSSRVLRGGVRGHDNSSRVLRGGVRGHDDSSRVLRGGVRGHGDSASAGLRRALHAHCAQPYGALVLVERP